GDGGGVAGADGVVGFVGFVGAIGVVGAVGAVGAGSAGAVDVGAVAGGGGAGGSKWNERWIRLRTGEPARVAGVNVHCLAAAIAASSNAGPPDFKTSVAPTRPSVSISTA